MLALNRTCEDIWRAALAIALIAAFMSHSYSIGSSAPSPTNRQGRRAGRVRRLR